MTEPDAAQPGDLLALPEIDELARQMGDVEFTIEDVVLLVLRADPRPVRGAEALAAEVRRALAGALAGRAVEPAAFEAGPGGRMSSREVEYALDSLSLSGGVRAIDGDGGGDKTAFEIAPRGVSRIKEKWDALSPDARRALARARAERDAEVAVVMKYPAHVNSAELPKGGLGAVPAGGRGGRQAAEAPASCGADAAKLQEYVDRGDHLYGEEKYDEAYAAYEMASRLQAPDAGLHFRMARSLAGMELYKDALDHCRAAIKANPADAGGYAAMAHCLHRLGRHSKALPYSLQAVLRGPSTHQAYMVRGAILSKLGRHSEALSNYQRAVRLDPGSAEARRRALASLLLLGRYKEALPHAEHLAKITPEDPAAHERVVDCLSRMGRHEDAVSAGRKAAEAAPDRADSYRPIMAALLASGSHEEVLEWSARALEADPGNPRPHIAAALSLRELGRLEEALERCRRAADLGAGGANFHLLMSYLLGDLGRLDEALFHCKAAVSARPGDPQALSNTGGILSDMGRHEEALACLGRALRIDPKQPTARYNRALSLQSTGRQGEALEEYKRAVELDPGSASAYNNMGIVLAALDRGGEALAHFDRAIELDPGNAASHHNKALALQHLGLGREALAHFDRALELGPGNADAYVGRLSCMSELGLPDEEIGRYARDALGPAAAEAGVDSSGAGRPAVAAEARAAAEHASRRRPAAAPEGAREQHVESLLSRDESEVLEFKSWPGSRRDRPSKPDQMEENVAKELCGLLNTRGGDLLIGVGDDDGKVEGLAPCGVRLERKERGEMLEWMANVVADYLGAGCSRYLDYAIVGVRGLDVLHCAVAASTDEPVILRKRLDGKHEFFARIGNTCRPFGLGDALGHIAAKWPDWSPRRMPAGPYSSEQEGGVPRAVKIWGAYSSGGGP